MMTIILSPIQDTCRRWQAIQVDTTCIWCKRGVNAVYRYWTKERSDKDGPISKCLIYYWHDTFTIANTPSEFIYVQCQLHTLTSLASHWVFFRNRSKIQLLQSFLSIPLKFVLQNRKLSDRICRTNGHVHRLMTYNVSMGTLNPTIPVSYTHLTLPTIYSV